MPEAKLPFLVAGSLDLQEDVIKKLARKCEPELGYVNQPRVSLRCAFYRFGESDNALAGAYP